MEYQEQNGILYEVVVSAEWPSHLQAADSDASKDAEKSEKPNGWSVVLLRPLLWFLSWISWWLWEFVGRYSVPENFMHLWRAQIPWKIAVVRSEHSDKPDNPTYAAIVKSTNLEVRRFSDEFVKAVEEIRISGDSYPYLRKIAWSPDGKFVALVQSDGKLTIFDRSSGKSCQQFASKPWAIAGQLIRLRIVSEILWTNPFTSEDAHGLVLTLLNGSMRLYGISHDGKICERSTIKTRSRKTFLSKCICAAAYARKSDLVVTASSINQAVDEDLDVSWKAGLVLWRMVNEVPFLVPAPKTDTSQARNSAVLYSKFVRARDGVIKMALNQSEDALVTLFASGCVAVWAFPSLRLRRLWMAEDMPKYTAPSSNTKLRLKKESFSLIKDLSSFPTDVEWWSDSVIILCQANGAVSLQDITGRELFNITHGSFERFRPGCKISCSFSDTFLVLEEESSGKPWDGSDSLDGEISVLNTSDLSDDSEDMRSILSETLASLGFEEPVPITKPKKTVSAYRLNCFQTASPLEMFNRKLGNEEYEEALVIAQRFGLDSNLVYQKRWLKSPVTKEAISDYLVKISNPFWVLRECLDRVPSDPDVVRDLLNVGLRLTSLSNILALHPECCPEIVSAAAPVLKKSRSAKARVNYDIDCSPEKVDISKLHPEQISMIGHRRQLLRYIDMLTVYEEILGGGEKALRYFLATEYKEIRRGSFLELALHYAQNCKPEELHTLRFLRSDELLPFWLDILSNFPETFSPEKYQFLIPSTLSGEILNLPDKNRRPPDWSEQEPFSSVNDQGTLEYNENLSRMHGALLYKGDFTPQQLGEWLRTRTLEIESRTGLVENSQQMIKIATAKGLQDFATLRNDFETLISLVYGAQLHDMTFEKLKILSDEQVLRLFDKCELVSFPSVLRLHILPFLKRCELKRSGDPLRLLRDYLVEISSAPNTLDKCLKIFQQSLPNMPDPIISSATACVQLAVDCIYANSRLDQLEQMKAILECLPSQVEQGGKGDAIDPAFEQASELEEFIRCIEFFSQFGIQLGVRSLREIKHNEAMLLDFLSHFLKVTTQKSPGFSENEWRNIFSQYSRICTRLFPMGKKDMIIELFAGALLRSGKVPCIKLGTKFLTLPSAPAAMPLKSIDSETWVVSEHLSQVKSIALLVTVGKEYFNNSDNWKDPRLQHARRCFELIQEVSEDARRELKLIAALDLLHMCGVDAEPLDLRTNPDRFRFVQQVLNVNNTIYKYVDRVMELTDALEIKEKARIVEMVAGKAFDRNEYAFCRDLCERLMDEKRESSWEICLKLATVDEFPDTDFKKDLFIFAVASCPADRLSEVMEKKNQFEMMKLKSGLAEFNPSDVPLDWIDPIAKLPIDPCWIDSGMEMKSTSVEEMFVKLKGLSTSIDYLTQENLMNDEIVEVNHFIISLVMEVVKFDVSLSLQLLGFLRRKTGAEEFFDMVPETASVTHLAAYFYALESQLSFSDVGIRTLLQTHLNDVIKSSPSADKNLEYVMELQAGYRKYLSKLQPSTPQTKSACKEMRRTRGSAAIQSASKSSSASANVAVTLKGVDEVKFRSDSEYRTKSILRSAASKDPVAVKNALKLAAEHGIASWEVVASFVKFLYTQSDLTAETINVLVQENGDLMAHVKENRQDFIKFSGQHIQPLMANADISILESYYDFLESIKKMR
ncbi:NBAS subunit of NRZ tethering complex-like [Paramacrobiotus metropolitanus]|uniref:NBAS subunit of NRZ tethering complex-like n=1 Tax=Paramacrobiotus metropolitanus TaxID=2943436 RepID=UPI0024459B19|nr:NBAS subunit of NRZ tethering complex-like [Paramacrobiotus metropolitanus]